ncbi:MAG TPA: sulfotransferase [Rhizomicrobium sp.]|nr:sulfotransferase [Rhizomicrobium sp.]
MALKVIGTGFGRTGTHSLKLALEMLGQGPCYHMMEVFPRPEHSPAWQALAEGGGDGFDALLSGFPATVDWPTTYFWRPLMARNPGAKILHTERPAEEWYQSISQTIFPALQRPQPAADAPEPWPGMRAHQAMIVKLIREDTFGGDLSRDNAIKVYEAHNQAVRRDVPAENLLVFNPRDGWEPLCAFLGVPVPDVPYPKTNSTDEFRARVGLTN